MNNGENHDRFPLVRRPSSAVEKAAPGAKRILSGMVADTLALVKGERAKPIFTVLLGLGDRNENHFYEMFERFFRNELGQRYELKFLHFEKEAELLHLAQTQLFDLTFVILNNIHWDMPFVPSESWHPIIGFLEQFKTRHEKPIITSSGYQNIDSERLRRAGIPFLCVPFSEEQFRYALKACLEVDGIMSVKTRPFRIVHVDDEDWLLEMVSSAIRTKFKTVIIDTFQNGDKAWEELRRADPDFLITDLLNNNIPGRTESFGMNGYELLPLLAKRNVKYPILVLSGSLSREGYELRTRQLAGPNLNVSYLKKPFTQEQLYAELDKHIKL